MKRAPRKVRLSSPVAEYCGHFVVTGYWIKIGLPRDYLPLLKQLAAKLGYKRAPVAAAARALILLAVRETAFVDAQISRSRCEDEALTRLLKWTSEHSGSDSGLN